MFDGGLSVFEPLIYVVACFDRCCFVRLSS